MLARVGILQQVVDSARQLGVEQREGQRHGAFELAGLVVGEHDHAVLDELGAMQRLRLELHVLSVGRGVHERSNVANGRVGIARAAILQRDV